MNTDKLKLISSMLIFGTIGIFVHYIPLPTSFIATFRGFCGMIFLLLAVFLKGKKISLASIRKNLFLLILSGAFIGANWIFLFEAYRYTSVATATLCYYTAPVFVILVSPFLLKERLALKKIVCAVVSLTGMALICGISEGANLYGCVLGLCAAALYAGVVVAIKLMNDISSYDMTIIQLGVAGAVILPYAMITEKINTWQFDTKTVFLLIGVGVIHTGIAYLLYFSSIKGLCAQTAAILSYIDPATAVLLSALVLREKLDAWSVIGAIMILGSSAVCESKRLNFGNKKLKNSEKDIDK